MLEWWGETDLYVQALLGDLRFCCCMCVPEDLQVITSGCKLTLTASQISLQASMIGFHQPMLCEQDLQHQSCARE